MSKFDSLDELMKYIQQQITSSLEDDVAKDSIELMKQHIQEDVYNAYTPYSTDGITPHYERTYKLLNSNESEMLDENTLMLTNTRHEGDRDIVAVIESGQGYGWGYTRDLDEEIGARPFMKNTKDDLKDGKLREYMKKALEKRFGKGSVK